MWRALLSHAFQGLLVRQTAVSATGRESGSRAYEEEEEADAAWEQESHDLSQFNGAAMFEGSFVEGVW